LIAVTSIAAAVASSALSAGAALAAAGNGVINDCEANGRLTHTYTRDELRHALAVMPASVKTYTNCYDVLNQALLSNTPTGGGSGSGGGGSFLPTPVIVILVALILGGVTFGALAIRRGQAAAAGDAGDAGAGPGDATREYPGGADTDDATRELPGGGDGPAGPSDAGGP
jgi:hypothetical protein